MAKDVQDLTISLPATLDLISFLNKCTQNGIDSTCDQIDSVCDALAPLNHP